VNTISREKLKHKIDENKGSFLLVETLGQAAYDHEHLPGAINLPPDRISELAPAVLPDKNAEIIVYCSKPS
jgi:rhodanese-related sulfurtransferase